MTEPEDFYFVRFSFGFLLLLAMIIGLIIGIYFSDLTIEKETQYKAIIIEQQHLLDIRLNSINQMRGELLQCRSING